MQKIQFLPQHLDMGYRLEKKITTNKYQYIREIFNKKEEGVVK